MSKNKARPCDVTWIRSVVGQCKAAGVPPYVKQLGANVLDNDTWIAERWPKSIQAEAGPDGYRVRLRNRSGAAPAEWPEDLRVRELP